MGELSAPREIQREDCKRLPRLSSLSTFYNSSDQSCFQLHFSLSTRITPFSSYLHPFKRASPSTRERYFLKQQHPTNTPNPPQSIRLPGTVPCTAARTTPSHARTHIRNSRTNQNVRRSASNQKDEDAPRNSFRFGIWVFS